MRVLGFDIKQDNQLIANGTHFWCEACLVARPLEIQSPDPRYCQDCYNSLLQEVGVIKLMRPLTLKIKPPDWIPRVQMTPTPSPPSGRNLSIVNNKKNSMDIIEVSVAKRAVFKHSGKRGPKPRELPEDLIAQLAGNGIGAVAIASLLKREHGIRVSYKTIQRMLSGKQNS